MYIDELSNYSDKFSYLFRALSAIVFRYSLQMCIPLGCLKYSTLQSPILTSQQHQLAITKCNSSGIILSMVGLYKIYVFIAHYQNP